MKYTALCGKKNGDRAACFKYAISVLFAWIYQICPAWDARLLDAKPFQDCCHVCTFYNRCFSWLSAIPIWFVLQLLFPAAIHVKFPLHLSVLRLVHYFCCMYPLTAVLVHCDFQTCRPNTTSMLCMFYILNESKMLYHIWRLCLFVNVFINLKSSMNN